MRICLLFCVATVSFAAVQQQKVVLEQKVNSPQKTKLPQVSKGDVFQQQIYFPYKIQKKNNQKEIQIPQQTVWKFKNFFQQQVKVPQTAKLPKTKKEDGFQQQVQLPQQQVNVPQKQPAIVKIKDQKVPKLPLKGFKSTAMHQQGIGANKFTIDVRTSDCRKAHSDAHFTFWFTDGYAQNGQIKFNRESDVLGPFEINGNKQDVLKTGQWDGFGPYNAEGDIRTIEQTMKLMIIKKSGASLVWTAVSDGWKPDYGNSFWKNWKPEFVSARWENSRGEIYNKEFVFDSECDAGWLRDNDFYVINHHGEIYQIKDSSGWTVDDIFDRRFLMSNVERIN